MKRLNLPVPSLQALIILLAAASLLLVQLSGFADDPGVGWHLLTGQYIAANWAVPSFDPFLQAPAGGIRPWVADQWLSDLFLFLLYRAGSWAFVYAVLTVIFLGTFVWSLYAIARSEAISPAASIACLYSFKLAQVHFVLRPVMLAFPFFLAVYGLLLPLARESPGTANYRSLLRRRAIVLPATFAVWANCHPSFVLGFVLLAVLLACGACECFRVRTCIPAALRDLLTAICLGIGCFIATIANPNGLELHRSIASLAGSGFFMNFHVEWLSPDFKRYEGVLFEFGLAAVALAIALALNERRRSQFFELAAAVVFAHLALRSVRILPFFAIVAALPLARLLSGAISWAGGIVGHLFYLLTETENGSRQPLLVMALVSSVICGRALSSEKVFLYNRPLGPSAENYPYEAVAALRERSLSEGPLVVASTPNWGGFISFFGQGRLKPIIDDRNTLLGETFYKEYFAAMRPDPKTFDSFGKALQFHYLLLSPDSTLALYLRNCGGLPLVFTDKKSIVFYRPAANS